ncbi:MAG: hypothetical protein AAF902_01805 [Chloroflexota bacterium]
MTHLFENLLNLETDTKVKSQSKVISNSSQAIKRSKELLREAEEAVTRSYAVVELSKRFVDSLSDTKKEEAD